MLVSQSQLSCWGKKSGGTPSIAQIHHFRSCNHLHRLFRSWSQRDGPFYSLNHWKPQGISGKKFWGRRRGWKQKLGSKGTSSSPTTWRPLSVLHITSISWVRPAIPPYPRGCAESMLQAHTLGRCPQSQQITLISNSCWKLGKRGICVLWSISKQQTKWKGHFPVPISPLQYLEMMQLIMSYWMNSLQRFPTHPNTRKH